MRCRSEVGSDLKASSKRAEAKPAAILGLVETISNCMLHVGADVTGRQTVETVGAGMIRRSKIVLSYNRQVVSHLEVAWQSTDIRNR